MQIQTRSDKPEIRSDKYVNRSDKVVKPVGKVAKRSDKPVKVVEKRVNRSDKLVIYTEKAETWSEKVRSGFVCFRRRNRKTGSAFLIYQKRILRDEMVGKKIIFSGNPVGGQGKIFILGGVKPDFH